MSDTSESPSPFPRAEKPEFLTQKRFDEFALPTQLLTALSEAGAVATAGDMGAALEELSLGPGSRVAASFKATAAHLIPRHGR